MNCIKHLCVILAFAGLVSAQWFEVTLKSLGLNFV